LTEDARGESLRPISGFAVRSAWSQASATRHPISEIDLTCALKPSP
jgi:hypothetical protein